MRIMDIRECDLWNGNEPSGSTFRYVDILDDFVITEATLARDQRVALLRSILEVSGGLKNHSLNGSGVYAVLILIIVALLPLKLHYTDH